MDNMDLQLRASFDEFRRNKNAMEQIHKDTLVCFQNIEKALGSHKLGKELAHEIVTEMTMAKQGSVDASMILVELEGTDATTLTSSLSDILYTKEEQEEVSALFAQSPALIVVGQTNSGKSSIINEILRSRIVSTSDQPCTSRIVKLTYSKEDYVRLVDRRGKTIEEFKPNDKKIPREMIELREGDRASENRVTAKIEAGFDIPFLKSGVDIIDSPGRDENEALDELVRVQLKNILPFIVYVIDGHNLFTALDKSVLDEINERKSDLDIFFVVSKIEPQEEDSSDEEEEEDDEDDDYESVQDNKKRRVFEQLVKNGLLTDDKEIKDQEYFHGLSAWKLSEYRRKKRKNPDWNDPHKSYKEYIDAFERFQSCLKNFSDTSLKASTRRSCQTLISVLQRCLYFFIEKANSLKQNRDSVIAMLNRIEEEEKLVHDNVAQQVEKHKSEIVDVMVQAIDDLKGTVPQEARTFQYGEEFSLPIRDGFVKSKEAVSQCRKQIQQLVFNAVFKRIEVTLMKMFSTRDNFFEELEQRVKTIEEEAALDETTTYEASAALHNNLVKCYQVNPDIRSNGFSWEKLFKKFREILVAFLKHPRATITGKVKVGDPEWKSKTALETISEINVPQVATELIKSLKSHFESCHNQFIEQLKNILRVLRRGGTLKDEQRKVILDFAPDVASLEMLCHSVNDHARFGRPQPGEMIGAGAQGNVFTCRNIVTPEGKPCVVKVVPVGSESLLKDLTLELHTTRTISHPNILPIVCTTIEPNPSTGIRVSIVTERMKCDLQNALKEIPSLRIRLMILLDVALALQYLHHKGLMHRDIKLQNVLVDENNRGYLTDFGLCKPEGLASGSLVGTPIAMAPEMIAQCYSKSVDVYAFGILMWRVCEGQGNQPQNIFLFPVPLIMLAINAKEKRKPEHKDCFLPSCWKLMEKCWGDDPEARPSFDDIVKDLKQILDDKCII
ncbi:dual serine/threonine and tyrosine protein kinase [Exaiptasia diaphana]|uniref:Dual serine/threonine and tyrosine protein kinase n=1 Tax=Exaiptasia diaphana TaxID=2652724 RepID=A0A913WNS7_EXADI|nr:dual serine/threonine and tyrosine protein kinase [Exaiptasia diaphana]KXJ21152.1 Dual serine/threonine and tyrosine protein kinase [Exaiptasia diaphana]